MRDLRVTKRTRRILDRWLEKSRSGGNANSSLESPTRSGAIGARNRYRVDLTRLRMRRPALPNAVFIGFTGTPLFKQDEITKAHLRRLCLALRLQGTGHR